MLNINFTEIESDIKKGNITPRGVGFCKSRGDETIECIMQSEICHQYLGLKLGEGRRRRKHSMVVLREKS